MQPVFACRLSFARAPWASGWRAGDAALSAQRRVPDGVRPRVTREVRSGCVAAAPLAECLVLWFCVSLLCDRHRPSSVHPYRVGVPVVGRTVFRLPINQSISPYKILLAQVGTLSFSHPLFGVCVLFGATERSESSCRTTAIFFLSFCCLVCPFYLFPPPSRPSQGRGHAQAAPLVRPA